MKIENVEVGMKVVPTSGPAGLGDFSNWKQREEYLYPFFDKNGFLYVKEIEKGMGGGAVLLQGNVGSQLWFYCNDLEMLYEMKDGKQFLLELL